MRRPIPAVFAAALISLGLPLAAPALAAAPTITTFSPTSGPPGTVVAITGTNFATPATVTFGNVAAVKPGVTSATRVSARVPATAATGPITITSGGTTASSTTSFTVTPGDTVTPAAGPPGSIATVSVAGLASNEAADVYLDTNDLVLLTTNGSGAASTTITIPASTQPGTHWVSIVGRRSGLAAQTAFTVRSSWPDPGDTPADTGSNATENTISPSNAGQLDADWSASAGNCTCGFVQPAVANGLVIDVDVQDDTDDNEVASTVEAFAESTGQPRWSYSDPDPGYSTDPAIYGTDVYVGRGDTLRALNATTGAPVWSHTLPNQLADVVVAGGTVFATTDGTGSNALYALDATTGATRWVYGCSNSYAPGRPAVGAGGLAIECAGGTGTPGSLAFLDATTGSLRWYQNVVPDYESTVTIAAGYVLVTDLDSNGDLQLDTFSASAGSEHRTIQLPGEYAGPVTVAGGLAYVYTEDGEAFAVNPITGSTRWDVQLPDTQSNGGGLAVAGGVVFADGAEGDLLALSAATGEVLWSGAAENNGVDTPVVVDGAVFAVDYANLVRYTLGGAATTSVRRPAPDRLHPDYRRLPARSS